jgi:hypothetical protein
MIIIIKSFLFCFKKKRGLLPYPLFYGQKPLFLRKKHFLGQIFHTNSKNLIEIGCFLSPKIVQ